MGGSTSGGGVAGGGAAGGFDIQGLFENPLFQSGLGLLEANNASYGQNSNGITGALRGVSRAGQLKDSRLNREAFEEEQKNMAKLREALQAIYGKGLGAQGGPPGGQQAPQAGLPQVAQGIPQPPPVGGQPQQPNPFTQALGTSSVPGAQDIGALLLQYGNPAQQQAAFSQMSAGERFKQKLAAEETRYAQRAKREEGQIGRVTPSNYTPESIAKYQVTRDFGDLERYERVRQVDVGGVKYNVDSATGETIGAVGGGVDEAVDNKTQLNRAAASGTAQGTAITGAQRQLASLETDENELREILANPDFGASVGKLDSVTGRIGELFGSDQGVLGDHVQRVTNKLVVGVAEAWKGAISDREMELFLNSVPGRSSSEETWRSWFEKEYLPRKRVVERVASGEVFHDDRLTGGSSQTAKFTNTVDQSTADALAKYGVLAN